MRLLGTLFDLGIPAVAASVAFLLIFAVVAYIAFRMLKKTLKMVFRMAIVAVILVIAVVGSLSLWWFNSGSSSSPKSNTTKTR